MKKYLVGSLLAVACVLAHAEAPKVRFFGGLGYAFGGDTLASGTYTNGSTYEVNAGKGFTAALGLDYRVAEKVTLQGSVGYHSDSTNATNGEIAFKRMPVELLAFYDVTNQFRLGGGVRKSNDAEVTVSGAAIGSTAAGKYDSSTGAVIEGQYFFTPVQYVDGNRKAQMALTFRYVSETFKPQRGATGDKSGSHGAIGIAFYY